MAHLKTKETTNDRLQRKEWKFRLMRQLYEAGYERQDILNLYRFIDWLMRLPTDLEYQFKEQLDQYEQERQMPYITSIEKMGIEKGREEGREEERKEIAKRLLLQGVSVETIAQATDLTLEQIRQIQAD
jgi:predicted transposase/invertase (TIGR01784 family)